MSGTDRAGFTGDKPSGLGVGSVLHLRCCSHHKFPCLPAHLPFVVQGSGYGGDGEIEPFRNVFDGSLMHLRSLFDKDIEYR